jgi:hypothetical protein
MALWLVTERDLLVPGAVKVLGLVFGERLKFFMSDSESLTMFEHFISEAITIN